MSPAPAIPTFCHLARLRRRAAGTAAGPPLDEVERVERRLRLRREEQVGERLLLGPVALLDASSLRRLRSGRGLGRGRGPRRAPSRRAVDRARGRRPRGRGEVGVFAGRLLGRDRDRLVDQSRSGSMTRSTRPSSSACCGGQHLVLPHRVGTVSLTAASGPDEPWRELGRAPGGDEPEQAFRRGEMANVVGDHAVVAVQRELDPASERRQR